jgi:hypothetical protein
MFVITNSAVTSVEQLNTKRMIRSQMFAYMSVLYSKSNLSQTFSSHSIGAADVLRDMPPAEKNLGRRKLEVSEAVMPRAYVMEELRGNRYSLGREKIEHHTTFNIGVRKFPASISYSDVVEQRIAASNFSDARITSFQGDSN